MFGSAHVMMEVHESNSHADVIHACVHLPKFTRVFSKIQQFWGFPEFFEYADSLLFVGNDRFDPEKASKHDRPNKLGREGFPPEVVREILLLRHTFADNIEDVAHHSLNQAQIEEIKKVVAKRMFWNFTI